MASSCVCFAYCPLAPLANNTLQATILPANSHALRALRVAGRIAHELAIRLGKMMKTKQYACLPSYLLMCLMLLTGMGSLSTVQAAGLTNGNAETGSLGGWLVSSSQRISAKTQLVQTTGDVLPKEGNWFFCFASAPGSFETMEQSGPIPDGTNTLQLTGFFQSERLSAVDNDDFGGVLLQALDSSTQVVAEITSGPLVAAMTLQWEQFSLQLQAPVSAVSWRLEMQGTLRFGSYINVFYDDLGLAFTTTGNSYSNWARINIANPSMRGTGQDADRDGLSNLLEYSGRLNPDRNETDAVFWLRCGSDVAATDVDLFYRESLDAISISREFSHAQALTNAFAPVNGRGPYVVETGNGYHIKRLRLEDMPSDHSFFKLEVGYTGD